jgi:hypothetical protein
MPENLWVAGFRGVSDPAALWHAGVKQQYKQRKSDKSVRFRHKPVSSSNMRNGEPSPPCAALPYNLKHRPDRCPCSIFIASLC